MKHNALVGRDEELTCWEDYPKFARYWLDHVANVRMHHTTKERPMEGTMPVSLNVEQPQQAWKADRQ